MESEKVREVVKLRKANLALLDRWQRTLDDLGNGVAVLRPDGSVARSFEQLGEEAAGVASQLDKLRMSPGAVVTLLAGNVVGWPAMVLGIWQAGGAVLLVDATWSESQIAEAEETARAAARVTWDGAPRVELIRSAGPVGRLAADVALIKLTSGTTGAPRALEFDAAAVLADCDQVCETMGISRDDVNYAVIAFAHSYGFSNLVAPLLFCGVPLVAAEDSLPRAVWSGVAASGATVLPAVPAIFRALGRISRTPTDPRQLRLCISAGAPLTARVAEEFRNAHGLKIHSFYGASECGGICYDASERSVPSDGFVGTAMRGVELRWETGDSGAVWVKSAAVCRGTGGTLRPGDLLEGSETTGYRIVGRPSEIVNVGGRKVNPAAVEAVIAKHPAVDEVAVFGRGDAARVQSLAAVVVGGATGTEVRRWCAEQLATWQVPREIFVVDAIPVTARGKVSRRALADWCEVGTC